MGFSETSSMTKVGLLLSIIAFLFDLIGFSTPNWIDISISHQGLFQRCLGSVCLSYTGLDWQIAARALSVIGFLLGTGCVVVIGVYVLLKTDMNMLKKLGSILAFTAAGFIIIGASVFAGKFTEFFPVEFLSWSFALTIVGGILYIPAGVLMLLQ